MGPRYWSPPHARADPKQDPRDSRRAPHHDRRHAKGRRLAAGETTVGYANEGLTLHFLCGLDSQKAANLARDNRVSLTIDHDTDEVMEITGVSMAARCEPVLDHAEGERVMRLLFAKYSPQKSLPLPMPKAEEVRIFRVKPVVISLLDYTKGFGHTDLVELAG